MKPVAPVTKYAISSLLGMWAGVRAQRVRGRGTSGRRRTGSAGDCNSLPARGSGAVGPESRGGASAAVPFSVFALARAGLE